jgi:sugar-specific transcriptional regulator TrmB
MLIKDLESAGLSSNEARTYLASLELGETTVSRIAKKSGVKRTTSYLIIEALKEKGLISSIKKGAQTHFFAENPKKIKNMLKEREEKIDKIMPELLSFANLIDKKPKIRYFEGVDGVIEVYKDTLNYPSQEILVWAPGNYIGSAYYDYFDGYIEKRIENKIWMRAITPNSKSLQKYVEKDKEQLRKTKLIEAERFKTKIEIDLYGKNKIGLMSHKEEIGVIIESQDIHDTLKEIFEVMWGFLPEQSK